MEDELIVKLYTILFLVIGGSGAIVYFIYRAVGNDAGVNSEEEKDIIDLNDHYHGGKN